MSKKNNKRKEKKTKFVINIVPIIISVVSLIVSIITVGITIKEEHKNELILTPRFSLEKNTEVDENGLFIWKISNLGGAISNATIYPVMYISFSFYNKEQKKDIDITLEMSGYYNNYYYRNSDGSFYVKDDKQSELDCFIEKYINLIHLDGFVSTKYSINPCFVLHYDDYKENACNKIYTIVDDDLIEDGSGRNYINTMKQLKEISKLPSVDIKASLEQDASRIEVNYKNAKTTKLTHNEKEYNDYLHSAILELINTKDKHVEEMLGDVILSNGNLWRRDANTGVLICVANNVKEYGFTKDLNLTWLTNDGVIHMVE